jgi:hypothetical protein
MSTVPTRRSSVTPRGICTKGASRMRRGTSPLAIFSARPSCRGGGVVKEGCEGGSGVSAGGQQGPVWRGGEKGGAPRAAYMRGAGRHERTPAPKRAHLPAARVIGVGVADAALHDLDRRQQRVQAARHDGLGRAAAPRDRDTAEPGVDGAQQQRLLDRVLADDGGEREGALQLHAALRFEPGVGRLAELRLHLGSCGRAGATGGGGQVSRLRDETSPWPSRSWQQSRTPDVGTERTGTVVPAAASRARTPAPRPLRAPWIPPLACGTGPPSLLPHAWPLLDLSRPWVQQLRRCSCRRSTATSRQEPWRGPEANGLSQRHPVRLATAHRAAQRRCWPRPRCAATSCCPSEPARAHGRRPASVRPETCWAGRSAHLRTGLRAPASSWRSSRGDRQAAQSGGRDKVERQ